MKNWSVPAAEAQPFAANEYVSACYNTKCKTDNRDTWPGTMFKQVVMDTNGNGVYDAGSDEIFYQSGGFFCCGQYRTVKVNGPVPKTTNGSKQLPLPAPDGVLLHGCSRFHRGDAVAQQGSVIQQGQHFGHLLNGCFAAVSEGSWALWTFCALHFCAGNERDLRGVSVEKGRPHVL